MFGVEYADIGAEEGQLFSQREHEKMKGSNRHVGPSDIKPISLTTFMPGVGKGIFYLKRVFVDRQFEAAENPDDFCFRRPGISSL